MSKEEFIQIIHHPEKGPELDLSNYENLVEKYPYFQIGYVFIAKIGQDQNIANKKPMLSQAALHTSDRSVLKKIMQGSWPNIASLPDSAPIQKNDASEQAMLEDKQVDQINTDTEQQNEALEAKLRKDQMINPELQEQVNAVEKKPVDNPSEEPVVESTQLKNDPAIPEMADTPPNQSQEETEGIDIKEFKQAEQFIDQLEIQDSMVMSEETPEPDPEKLAEEVLQNLKEAQERKSQYIEKEKEFEVIEPKEPSSLFNVPEADSIENKKEDLSLLTSYLNQGQVLENPQEQESHQQDNFAQQKQKEQFDIIDNFITNEKFLRKYNTKNKATEEKQQEDLSTKSTSIGDDLISENLAMIMQKQGKVNKAIDIYKKLIWKFPQKKTYFAAQIEELKKQ
ncbi:MAG: hypothetical protein ACNS62_24315 [Candidatus Cyclobacteriaceae bacterium M3_2C_046]